MANWNIRLLSVTSILLAATAAAGIAAAQTTAKTAPDGQVTFTKNVAPILERACQNCHRTAPSRRCRC